MQAYLGLLPLGFKKIVKLKVLAAKYLFYLGV